ncbi:MAG: DUF3048 domain-containing protein [Lachnospiraceae bacterium]|nr:DUF3048 domain-containing protein [Lachnospiraceae bacterium]
MKIRKLSGILLVTAAAILAVTGCASRSSEAAIDSVFVIDEVLGSGDEGMEQTTEEEDGTHEGMVRSRLTNEWIDEDAADLRPLAVMIPNESSAIPHYGLSQASILYECLIEGSMTRLMGIFEDYEEIGKLGNVRSLRDYYAYWALEWDAVICHFGGPYYADEILAEETTDDLDGNVITSPYYRSTDRSAPHNAYIDTSQVADALEAQGIEASDRGLTDDYHYLFADESTPNTLEQYTSAQDYTSLDMSACYPLTRCYFQYDEQDGLYYRFQYLSGGTDGPHIDGTNGAQLSFSNIIIQSVEYSVRDENGYLWFNTTDTSGQDAWLITSGKIIKCTWQKGSTFSATRYYDENGDEIVLNTGKTMVLIIEAGSEFSYE